MAKMEAPSQIEALSASTGEGRKGDLAQFLYEKRKFFMRLPLKNLRAEKKGSGVGRGGGVVLGDFNKVFKLTPDLFEVGGMDLYGSIVVHDGDGYIQ